MDETSSLQEISAADLQQLSATLVKQQRLQAPTWDHRSALLTGRMWVAELEPGMQLRLADIQDRFGLTSQALLPAGVKIALVIDGSARVRYGDTETLLGPEADHSGLLVALPSAASFMRFGEAGTFERTLTLSLSPHWLARHRQSELITSITGSPTLKHWSPSPGLLALTSNLFSHTESDKNSVAYRLQLTGLATTMAGEALASMPQAASQTTAPASYPRLDRRLAKLMNMIDSGQAKGLTQADLAHQLGMSLSNLQRRFQRQYGEALGSFLRRHHLDLARDAMARKAISIDTAAALAGYSSAANFATAFKREFGVRPSVYQQATDYQTYQKRHGRKDLPTASHQ